MSMKRLKRIAKQMYSKLTLELSGFLTPSGLYYTFSVRLLNKKPMYSISCRDVFESWSVYDGENFEFAFEFYCELAIAIKGLSFAEDFARQKQRVETKIYELIEQEQDLTVKMKPLFLGDSEFATS